MSVPPVKKSESIIARLVSQTPPSGIRKYFDLIAGMEGVVSLGVGEPDFATPRNICEAAISSLEKGYTMYTSNAGMPELRQELARHIFEVHGIEYDPATEILVTVGVSEGVDLAMRSLLNPGDEVIMPDPCYVSYNACVVLAGGVPVMIPTTQQNNFELNPADVEANITEKTRVILLGFPANPTGAVMPREKLVEIGEIARRHNLVIVSDEIYSRLVYGVEHTCVAGLPGMRDSSVLLGGFSKAYAMTGWRIGYAAASKEIIGAMTKIHQYTMLCAPIMGQIAALEALRSGEESVTDMLEEYNQRRLVIVRGLNELGLTCFEPKGAFYAFPSIVSTGMTSEEFAEKLLMEEKVAVVHGNAFGQCGEGYVRCCYAVSVPDIEEALVRIKRFVTRHSGY